MTLTSSSSLKAIWSREEVVMPCLSLRDCLSLFSCRDSFYTSAVALTADENLITWVPNAGEEGELTPFTLVIIFWNRFTFAYCEGWSFFTACSSCITLVIISEIALPLPIAKVGRFTLPIAVTILNSLPFWSEMAFSWRWLTLHASNTSYPCVFPVGMNALF